MQKTSLEQFRIGSIENCVAEFSKKTPKDNSVIPIVLTPAPRPPCSMYMSIPTGPHCIMHRFGRDEGYNFENASQDYLAPPGFACLCAYNRIAYCVTAQAVTYNAPVKSCPTADNVMVDCDLTLIFSIGPAPRQVKMFVYKLGARRFDEMLDAAVEEAIRHLIRTCPHTDIYELRGGNSDKVKNTLRELNKKFQPFGVNFRSAAITDVRFSQALQSSLQNTTEFASKMKEEEKRQKNELDKIKFKKNRELTDLERQHARIIQDLQAHRTRVEINRSEQKVKADGQARVVITQAKQDAKVAQRKAESEKKVAKNKGEADKEEKVSMVIAACEAKKKQVAAECKAMILKAQKRRDAASKIAEALMKEGEVELKASSMLKQKRNHDLRMAKNEAFASLATRTKIILSGQSGEDLIKDMVPEEILGSIKVA